MKYFLFISFAVFLVIFGLSAIKQPKHSIERIKESRKSLVDKSIAAYKKHFDYDDNVAIIHGDKDIIKNPFFIYSLNPNHYDLLCVRNFDYFGYLSECRSTIKSEKAKVSDFYRFVPNAEDLTLSLGDFVDFIIIESKKFFLKKKLYSKDFSKNDFFRIKEINDNPYKEYGPEKISIGKIVKFISRDSCRVEDGDTSIILVPCDANKLTTNEIIAFSIDRTDFINGKNDFGSKISELGVFSEAVISCNRKTKCFDHIKISF